MKSLYVTNQIPKDATVLLVDLEEKYFEEVLEYEEPEVKEIINKRITKRLNVMKKTLEKLKKSGHKILAINVNDIYEGFEDIPDEYLPQWDSEGMDLSNDDIGAAHRLNPVIIERIAKESNVVVCGLWKELCVYIVARKLQEEYGENVLMYLGSDLTLENGMMWTDDDIITLKAISERDGVTIKEIIK